jgi:ligand-binding sensor domain-containing protein
VYRSISGWVSQKTRELTLHGVTLPRCHPAAVSPRYAPANVDLARAICHARAMESEWLVGENGLFRGSPARGWTRAGGYPYCVNGIVRFGAGLVVGTESGCWYAPPRGRWLQCHDETLTSVLAIAATPAESQLIAATAYGVATADASPEEPPPQETAPRWRWHSDDLGVNGRYSNALLVDPADDLRWLVGTEAGVLVREHGADRWLYSSLTDRPVRALCAADGAFWAGTDGGGVWRSIDGLTWNRAGAGLDDATVYSLAWTGDRLLAGLEGGLAIGDGAGFWKRFGPGLRVRTVAAGAGSWLAGASPGGLWYSDDAGGRWRKTGDFVSVRTITRREG